MQVLYNGMLENNCSEQASRMAAMESSTKNAKEMLGKLTLSYNRYIYTATKLQIASAHMFIRKSHILNVLLSWYFLVY